MPNKANHNNSLRSLGGGKLRRCLRRYEMRNLILLFLMVAFSANAEVDLVTVKKSINKMYLLEKGKVKKEYDIALGANPRGHKEQEGDEKTPEGRYILDYVKEDSSFYRSMHVSYPNKRDLENAKNKGVSAGGFIMVHGQKNNLGWLSLISQNFNWTDGCIALKNSEMDEFLEIVKVGTPIEISW